MIRVGPIGNVTFEIRCQEVNEQAMCYLGMFQAARLAVQRPQDGNVPGFLEEHHRGWHRCLRVSGMEKS